MDLRRAAPAALLAFLATSSCGGRPDRYDVGAVMRSVAELFVSTEAPVDESTERLLLPDRRRNAAAVCGTLQYSASSTTDLSCTETCPSTTSYSADCTVTAEKKFGCFGLNYGISGGKIAYLADFKDTAAPLVTVTIAANVRGWQLDGALACQMRYQMVANAETGASEFKIDCTTFSCTYNGTAIGCEDFQNTLNMVASTCNTSSS